MECLSADELDEWQKMINISILKCQQEFDMKYQNFDENRKQPLPPLQKQESQNAIRASISQPTLEKQESQNLIRASISRPTLQRGVSSIFHESQNEVLKTSESDLIPVCVHLNCINFLLICYLISCWNLNQVS